MTEELIKTFKEFSPLIATLIIISSVIIFVGKLIVEESLKKYLEKKFKDFEAQTERRTAFKDMLMLKRFEKVVEIHSKLIKVSTDINRYNQGRGKIPIDYIMNGELSNLTSIYEELESNRIILSQSNYDLLRKFADFLVEMANNQDKDYTKEFTKLNGEIVIKLDKEFDIEKTIW